jgi:hypothetical protein
VKKREGKNQMPSYVENVQNMMNRLLWDNLLEEWIRGVLLTVPVFSWPIIGPIASKLLRDFIEDHLIDPLFNALSRFGVFTSIDWQNQQIYAAYYEEAIKLVPLQEKEVWSPEDERKFTDAARKLIRFNLKLPALK